MPRATWCNASSTSLGVCQALTVRENSSNSPCMSGASLRRVERLVSAAAFMCEEPILPSDYEQARKMG